VTDRHGAAAGNTLPSVPWKERAIMDQREEFIRQMLANEMPISALCQLHGISRKTGYKWVERFWAAGVPGLVDRSHAPKQVPWVVSPRIEQAIVELRRRYPFWGPRKLRAWLDKHHPETHWPAPSTIGDVLRRHGLVQPRRVRRRTPVSQHALAACSAPNIVWCADFKGAFRVAGRYCHPLTISDGYSRFLLRCEAMAAEQAEPVKRAFRATFEEYGLPLRIRTDNGAPFASSAPGGLSTLSVWWVKLGILPERIEPAHPEQNGQHERLHRTLKCEATRPGVGSVQAQQEAFDRFRHYYNDERPHEALAQCPPASLYRPSSRPMPRELHDPEYPEHFEIARVLRDGRLRWHGGTMVVSTVLGHEVVGLEPLDEQRWQLWFGPIYLGLVTEKGQGKFDLAKNRPLGCKLEHTRRAA
jgi:putative transposase